MKLYYFGKNPSIGSRDRVGSSEFNISLLMKFDSFSKRDAAGLTKYFEASELNETSVKSSLYIQAIYGCSKF